ncbi:hypothetical protein KP509_14G089100 [Ceratopteris richardii]|uniref:Uncharacterized protein n=1 Tax=Ceratopteris richardii TaxID=49495 RepID=A0A8T2TDY3_CERRI|nr:hypothetical protein KP509_14G089100 [Ceratopteris richardii]
MESTNFPVRRLSLAYLLIRSNVAASVVGTSLLCQLFLHSSDM